MNHQQSLAEHLPHLQNLARAITRNADTADDLVQDTCLRALQRSEQLQCPSSLRSWLFSILRNLHRDYHRRAVRRETQDQVPEGALSTPPAQEQSIYFGEVVEAMAKLSSGELLAASALQYSYDEIADNMQIPVGTVRSRLSRARSALLASLEQEPPLAGYEAPSAATPWPPLRGFAISGVTSSAALLT